MRGDLDAEVLGGHVLDQVGLVQDDGVVVGDHRPVAAVLDREVGAEEVVVRGLHDALRVGARGRGGPAHADLRAVRAQHDALDGAAHALGDLRRLLRAGAGEQGGELVAADAGEHVPAAHQHREGRRDRLEQHVAGLVAVLVVDPLQMVDVDGEHGELLPRGGLQHAVELAAVAQPGERVGRRQTLEPRRRRAEREVVELPLAGVAQDERVPARLPRVAVQLDGDLVQPERIAGEQVRRDSPEHREQGARVGQVEPAFEAPNDLG